MSTFRVYLPFLEDRGAGLLRFASQVIQALAGRTPKFEVLLGVKRAHPGWLECVRYRVITNDRWASRLTAAACWTWRMFYLQVVYPIRYSRSLSVPLLLLAHESAPWPFWPQVAVVHDLTVLGTSGFRGSLARRIQHHVWIASLHRATHIIAISEATRRQVAELHPGLADRLVVVHEGVDREVFNAQAAPGGDEIPSCLQGEEYLLYAGTFAPHKNVEVLVDALALLPAMPRRMKLAFAGNHTDAARRRIAELAEKQGVSDRIEFLGFVSDRSLAALMRGCFAFVFPSLNEGFGLAPVEAMACGAPVLSSSAGSLSEVVSFGGRLLDPGAAGDWAAAILELMEEPSKRTALSERALLRANDFRWVDAADAYLALLKSSRRE